MKYLVNVSVADLRREPLGRRDSFDPHQETQLLFNERLNGYGVNNGWIFVEALEQQKCFSDGEWGGYRGWVRADCVIAVDAFPAQNLRVVQPWGSIEQAKGNIPVSLGTLLSGVEESAGHWKVKLPDGTEGSISKEQVKIKSTDNWRSDLVNRGKLLLEAPYAWGGRSIHRPTAIGLISSSGISGCDLRNPEFCSSSIASAMNSSQTSRFLGLAPKYQVDEIKPIADWTEPLTSVDCSGLVDLLYRTEGRQLPRDAHDQFLRCFRCEPDQLQPGDLIFLAPSKKPSRISHVMIFVAEDLFLEAEMKAQKVRLVSSKDKLKRSLNNLPYGYDNGEYSIYTSTFK